MWCSAFFRSSKNYARWHNGVATVSKTSEIRASAHIGRCCTNRRLPASSLGGWVSSSPKPRDRITNGKRSALRSKYGALTAWLDKVMPRLAAGSGKRKAQMQMQPNVLGRGHSVFLSIKMLVRSGAASGDGLG